MSLLPDPVPSKETLVAQVEALLSLVERQRLFIGSMRASNFWKVRDRVFDVLQRLGIRRDPLPLPSTEDVRIESAALGDPYQLFRAAHAKSEYELDTIRAIVRLSAVTDAFDVLIDTANDRTNRIETTLASLRDQLYPYWNVHVVMGGTAAPSRAGTFAVLLEAGDILEPDALLSMLLRFADGADIVYTDSDVLESDGVPRNPYFKPDWSPETLLTRNYVGRLCAFRSETFVLSGETAGGFSAARWYDALLRASEQTDRIVHVPQVLVHTVPEPDVTESLVPIVRDALERRGERANLVETACGIDVRFDVPGTERVSIVIPTRDRADLLARCLSSVYERTAYDHFDVVVVDNGSREDATRVLLDGWSARQPGRFSVVRDDEPFNFSRLINRAVRESAGSAIVMLNNDTEVISPNWLCAMLGQARRAPIGAVGALLLFEDETIQHAGVIVGGVLGLAGHAFRLLTVDDARAHGALELDTNYLAVTGACLMVARAKYEQVGGLDESFAVAYNDVDFCAKLHDAGYRNVVVPRARLFHYESKTRGADDTSAKRERGIRESEAFRLRWPQWVARDPYYNPNLTLSAENFSLQL